MFVVSLRDANQGVQVKTPILLAVKVFLRVACKEIKNSIILI